MPDSPATPPLRTVSRLVVPVEGGSDEAVVQTWTAELANQLAVGVTAVHVSTGPEEPPDDIFDHLRRKCEDLGVKLESVVLHDTDAVDALVAELMATDVVVIGTRRLPQGFHVGSVTEGLIRQAPCPVQVIRL